MLRLNLQLDSMSSREAYFKNEYTEMWIENGILYSKYAPNLKVTLDIAKVNVEERLKLCKGQSYPMFVYGANLRQLDKEAGKYLSSAEGTKGIKAGAFLAESHLDYLIMSLFVAAFSSPFPVKVFLYELKAQIWLNEFKD